MQFREICKIHKYYRYHVIFICLAPAVPVCQTVRAPVPLPGLLGFTQPDFFTETSAIL